MEFRKFNHKTPIKTDFDTTYLDEEIRNYKVDKESSFNDLLKRCKKCFLKTYFE